MSALPTQPQSAHFSVRDAAKKNDEAILARLQQAVTAAPQSLRKLDEAAGLSNGTTGDVLRGKKGLTMQLAFLIAAAAGADFVAIVSGAKTAPPVEPKQLHSPPSGAKTAPPVEPQRLHPDNGPQGDRPNAPTERLTVATEQMAAHLATIATAAHRPAASPTSTAPSGPVMSDEDIACGFMVQYAARNNGQLPTLSAIATAAGVSRRKLDRFTEFRNMRTLLTERAR